MKDLIGINEFVKRQTPESKYGHFKGTWEELQDLVLANFHKAQKSYRDDVLVVPVPPENFLSSIITVQSDTKLSAKLEARREGEMPYIQVVAQGAEKVQAKRVDVVIYSREALKEGNENTADADWEVVCINCYPTDDGDMMAPMARARNILQLEGGTDAKIEDKNKEELIALIKQMATEQVYWSTHAMIEK